MAREELNIENKEYWLNRAIIQDKKMDKDIARIKKQLKKLFVEVSKEIKKELAYFYANETDLTDFAKYRLESTLQAIYNSLDKIYHEEEETLNNALISSYIDTYKDVMGSFGIEASFTTINTETVKQVVLTNWSGLTFSERIWENRRRLALTIKQELKKGLIRGDSLQTMARILSDKLNVSFDDAMRLVHTETAWIQNEATKKGYEDAEVKYYEISAFLDKRTSDICRKMDGKIVKVEKGVAGDTLPPFHPRCRTCILPVVD